ncbi:sn-glycerol-3-phosphate import ATP-binding protein UgpC [Agrobacterium sp. DSM 25558]|uniref:ABC transporter ATP-binding protein n=1 Tax=Agrobacterium sp. DSM 25558 TaxID=1907665 RepID=UPI00097241BA|nr:ABC transporter ATP-binding protein [Agrobacterium sp. DSM 25558]SCX23114.1 sn-glycerol-3-phosphate import ATP-binding protein UgpC [Agrobacterium sp. DSM 25558]
MSFLSIQGLSKSYGGLTVLDHVDFDVKEGEFVVLLGPSGCGKSTLLSAIAGLDDIDSGRIFVDQKDVTDLEPKDRSMSMVFQSYALYPTKTVRKNLEFGLKVAGLPNDEIARRIAWAAELLQIDVLLDRKPGNLSGGQRQRVAIGRALVRGSKICLFDEPLSNLDAKLRNTMRLELRRLFQKLHGTAVYVTHDQVEAMTMADRVAVLQSGRIEQFDSPMQIYHNPATLFVATFLGNPAINLVKGRYDASRRTATTNGGLSLPLNHYHLKNEAMSDTDVIVGIRPEHIALASSDIPASIVVDAAVEAVEMQGSEIIVWLNIQDLRWSMKLPASHAPTLEGAIRVSLDPARLHVFCTRTEERL